MTEVFCLQVRPRKTRLTDLEKYAQPNAPDIRWSTAGWYQCNLNWPYTDLAIIVRFLGSDLISDKCKPVSSFCYGLTGRVIQRYKLQRACRLELYRKGENSHEHNGLLNLGNPVAREWITDRIDSLIKEYDVKVYRQDFNYDPMSNRIAAETTNRIGAPENLHVQGYLKILDTLKERNPGLIIDSCASGGRRNDLDTMRRAIPLQYTDVGLGNHPLKQIQRRYMFEWIPYFRAHTVNFNDALRIAIKSL